MTEPEQTETEGVWLHEDRLVYRLVQTGWWRGKPLLENRISLRAERGKGTSDDDARNLAALVCDLLNEAEKIAAERSGDA